MLWVTLLSLLLASSTSSSSSVADKSVVTARNGAVATDVPRCSRIGRKVLQEGGNAVDAAVTSALCLGVLSPASSGIGGGAFMLLRLANGMVKAFDMRETAPMKATQDMYAGNISLKETGALSIAVPGELAGLYKAWKHFGRLKWKRLVMPSEKLARKGFKVPLNLYIEMQRSESSIMAHKGLRDIFAPKGRILKPGEICRNKKLANTLKEVAELGVSSFYNASIGKKLVKDIKEAGGIITMEDLQHYQVRMREPISLDIMGLKILGLPPPASGGVSMMLILNILSQYGFSLNVSEPLQIHREIEAIKHAFAVRTSLGDPDFVDIKETMSNMLSPKFAAELKKTIYDDMTFGPRHYGGKWYPLNDHGTTHISIIDNERNVVSLTTTTNGYFGSLYVSPSTGIILNNQMNDFSIPMKTSGNVLPPATANYIRPRKRPMSSMTPIIILKDEQVKAVIGGSGGAKIILATTKVFLNHFTKGMDPFHSVMAPRTYHQLVPNILYYENWTSIFRDHFEIRKQVTVELKKKKHFLRNLADADGAIGGAACQFIVQDIESSNIGLLTAVSDPRKGGAPAGY